MDLLVTVTVLQTRAVALSGKRPSMECVHCAVAAIACSCVLYVVVGDQYSAGCLYALYVSNILF
jgi:hypothetical protein